MQINVLLSIKPEFATAIFSGVKKFEFRRTIFKNKRVNKIYVYASNPTCLVLGELELYKILTSDPESLWDATKYAAGITKTSFDRYFHGVEIAHALEISNTKLYKNPLGLKEMFNIGRPPQSFMYVDSPIASFDQ